MAAPYFSIIITVYNAERYLREALDSIAGQTCRDWECICIDDGSTDGSPRILDELAERDPRFRIVHQANGGVGRARNVGLDLARGTWITWADADDVLAPSRLAAAKRILDQEQPDFLHLWFTMAKTMPAEFKDIEETCPYQVYDRPAAIYECAYRDIHPFSMLWLSFAQRELFDGLRYPVGMRVKGDSILYASLFPRIRKLCRGEHTGYFYRLTEGSILRGKRKASDCIRFQEETANLWTQQHAYAASLSENALRTMETDLRYGAESDLLDWLTSYDSATDAEKLSVWNAHRNVFKTGIGRSPCRVVRRFRLGLAVYRATHWDGLVRLTSRIVAALRPLRNLIRR